MPFRILDRYWDLDISRIHPCEPSASALDSYIAWLGRELALAKEARVQAGAAEAKKAKESAK